MTKWAIGVDQGSPKIEIVAQIDTSGRLMKRLRRPTDAMKSLNAVEAEVIAGLRDQLDSDGTPPVRIGVGVAGQVESGSGIVCFAPNLNWHDVPLQDSLNQSMDLPVLVTNDVRAAAWSEWLYGAGQECNDLVCLFLGAGIGGGVVSGGKMLTGCSNAARELGHITIDLHDTPCHCGNRGCLVLGGGMIEGLPELANIIDRGIRMRALEAASLPLQILPARLKEDTNVIGAAAFALNQLEERVL